MSLECEEDRVEMIEALSMGYRVRTSQGEVAAIFDNRSVLDDVPSGFQMADRTPVLTITSCQALGLGMERGMPATVIDPCGGTTEYCVREPQADGTGMSRIVLEARR